MWPRLAALEPSRPADEVNAFFASGRDGAEAPARPARGAAACSARRRRSAEELEGPAQGLARQDAPARQRDRADLFEGGGGSDPVRRAPLPGQRAAARADDRAAGRRRGAHLAVHLAGSDFYEPIADERLLAARPLWQPGSAERVARRLPRRVPGGLRARRRRGRRQSGLSIAALHDRRAAARSRRCCATCAQARYDEGYERGVHDHDAAQILEKLLAMRESAGLLAYPRRGARAAR